MMTKDQLAAEPQERLFVQRERSGERSGEGFDPTKGPAQALTSKARSWLLHTNRGQDENGDRHEIDGGRPAPALSTKSGGQWYWEAPSTTVAGDPRVTARTHHEYGEQGGSATSSEDAKNGRYDGRSAIRISLAEAAILQGMPADYPFQGSRTSCFSQVGNLVPPPMAEAVIKALLDG